MDMKRVATLVLGLAVMGGGPALAADDSALVHAVKSGDTAAVRRLVGQRVDLNAPASDGATALHWAVHQDAADLVDALLTGGANANAANRYGVTPLSLAGTNGHLTIVNRLLAAGADPNAALPNGETILMTAARTGRPDVLQALLAKGANPNAREKSRGQTALMWAAAENNVAAIPVLLAAGAERDARTGDQTTVAVAAGSFSRAAGVTRTANLRPSFTALLFAVQRGQLEAARTLLDAGASVNEALPDGTSALVLAIQNAHWELASDLIERGANVNAAGSGFTALHQLTRIRRTNIGFMPPPVGKGTVSSTELARSLLAKGADVNAVMTRDFRDGYRNRFNRLGATPFLLAAKNADTELMKIYLAAGADPMTPNLDKTTALMVAAGDADGCVGGAANTTADTVRAALHCVGPAAGVKTVSSVMFLCVGDRSFGSDGVLAFADCAIVADPDAVQLAEIAIATAGSFQTVTQAWVLAASRSQRAMCRCCRPLPASAWQRR